MWIPKLPTFPTFRDFTAQRGTKKKQTLVSVVSNIIRVSWRRGGHKIWGDSLKACVERQLIVYSEFFCPPLFMTHEWYVYDIYTMGVKKVCFSGMASQKSKIAPRSRWKTKIRQWPYTRSATWAFQWCVQIHKRLPQRLWGVATVTPPNSVFFRHVLQKHRNCTQKQAKNKNPSETIYPQRDVGFPTVYSDLQTATATTLGSGHDFSYPWNHYESRQFCPTAQYFCIFAPARFLCRLFTYIFP